jgi:hypothetical protein
MLSQIFLYQTQYIFSSIVQENPNNSYTPCEERLHVYTTKSLHKQTTCVHKKSIMCTQHNLSKAKKSYTQNVTCVHNKIIVCAQKILKVKNHT